MNTTMIVAIILTLLVILYLLACVARLQANVRGLLERERQRDLIEIQTRRILTGGN